MTLPLKESQAIDGLAELFYNFLPWSGSQAWKGHVTFRTVAEKSGVGDFWQSGSKRPMIAALLEQTLEYRRSRFEPLILGIVRAGITYRHKQGNPVKPEEIGVLNGLLLEVGFKFPDLWNPQFHEMLRTDNKTRAKEYVERIISEERLQTTIERKRSEELNRLSQDFLGLYNQTDRQNAGLAFERILNKLFSINGLNPREPFRIVGEQIDGSFELDNETYIMEAKWEKHPLPEADLLVLRGKIEGRSAYTRGVFIAFNGITDQAKQAIIRGKQPNFFVIDGYDLTMVLSEQICLEELLRQKRRILAEEGLVFVPYPELWAGSRTH
jgi:Restriction endonuclease